MEAPAPEPSLKAGHLVILVHGINTRALWMDKIKPALERAGFVVAPTSYGKFGLLRFLSPFVSMRSKAISRVAADIRTAKQSYKQTFGVEPGSMSVISHSFGTYMVSRILIERPEFVWRRVIFCGSVVREDFDFDGVLERFSHPLLNEIGTKDYWPALAESVGWGYGSVGSTGFNRPPVETRWHKGLRHSDFLTERFCDRYWIPFLHGEKPVPADDGTDLPFGVRALTSLPLRWLIATLLPAAAALLIWSVLGALLVVPPWWWTAPVVGTKEQRLAQLAQSARLPDDAERPPLLSLHGTWRLLANGETVRFYVVGYWNKATFSYFGDTMLSVSARDDDNIVVIGNGLRCYYKMKVLSAVDMTWTATRSAKGFFTEPLVNERCPASTSLRRIK